MKLDEGLDTDRASRSRITTDDPLLPQVRHKPQFQRIIQQTDRNPTGKQTPQPLHTVVTDSMTQTSVLIVWIKMGLYYLDKSSDQE